LRLENRKVKNNLTLMLIALPGLILLIAFYYVPLLGWVYAFFDYKPGYNIWDCTFVGFKYFKAVIESDDLVRVMRNTFAISFLSLLTTPIPPLFAIFLSEIKNKKFQKFVQTATTLPNFISWIIIFSIAFLMFSVDGGMVNEFLLKWKLIDEPTNLLANSDAAWIFQTLLGLWKSLGFSAIIYFAAITSVDQELLDAASVDGAGRIARIRYITIPGLLPTYFTLLLISIGNILSNGFEQYYIFSNSIVGKEIEVLDVYIYNVGFYLNNYSLSTAFGILKILLSIALLFVANTLSKKLRGTAIL